MEQRHRIKVVFESKQGKFLFTQICGFEFKRLISPFIGINKKEQPEDVIVILNGGSETCNRQENVLALPGDAPPETLIYRHLFSMRDADPFWESISTTYTRQFAIIAQGGISLKQGDDEQWVKKWFKDQSPFWGRGNWRVYESWVKAHKKECLEFHEDFSRLLQKR